MPSDPPHDDAMQALAEAVRDRYTVSRRIGAGGMATVYLAEDRRLKRQVAIKVLRPELATILGSDRFLREIEVTARLQHPGILPLYDSGIAGDAPYYVMPFVSGETLRDRLDRERQLPADDVVSVVQGIASALQFAHDHGIVHRDIKPENILLHEGQPLVADFGIARAVDSTAGERLTATGLVIGTPLYMSPEQALGQSIDRRSDVYALAALTYEMLGGEPPYTGATAPAILTRQLSGPPRPLQTIRPSLPPAIDAVLARGMAAAPADRYEGAGAFATALREALAHPASAPARPAFPRLGIAVVALALIAAAAAAWRINRQVAPPTAPSVSAIAVLPFEETSGDTTVRYFGEGIAEELIGGLTKVPGLRVSPRSSTFQLRDDPGGVRAIGERLGVALVLEGTVRKSGARLRVTAQLIDVRQNVTTWTESFDRQDGDALALQEDLGRAILARLAPALSASGAEPALRKGTQNAAAFDLYLQGRYYFGLRTGPSFARAVDLFEQAIALDSNYARAWAGLADSYCIQSNFGVRPAREVCPRSLVAAQRALALDSTLAEAHASLGFAHLFYDWDLDGAEREFRRAIALDPLSATAHLWLMQVQSARGDTAGAIASMQRAVALEPFSPIIRTRLGTAYMRARRYREAIAEVRQVLATDSTYREGWRSLGMFLVSAGQPDSGLVALRRGASPVGLIAYAEARAGRVAEARRSLAELDRDPVARRAQALYAAFTLQALGDTDGAFERLAQAAAERTPDVVFSWVDPYLGALPATPRFARWADATGIPHPTVGPPR